MAAEQVGRVAYALEIDAGYIDVAIRRWQSFTGKDAIHVETQCCFDQLAYDGAERMPPSRRTPRSSKPGRSR